MNAITLDAVDLVITAAIATGTDRLDSPDTLEHADRLGTLLLGAPYAWTPVLELTGTPEPEWLIQAERCRRELQLQDLPAEADTALMELGFRLAAHLDAAGWERLPDGSDFIGIRYADPHWRRALAGASQLP